MVRTSTKFVLPALLLLLVAGTAPSAATERGTAADRATADIRAAVSDLRGTSAPGARLAPKDHECQELKVIACGETIVEDITAHDCAFDDGTLFDIVFFDGVEGETITATMTSTAFNPFLILTDPDVNIVATDDDSGPGLAARIVFTIDETSLDWALEPTPLEPFVTGPYTLSLECEDGQEPPPPPPSDGFFTDPSFPDFRFRVTVDPPTGPAIEGRRLADCQEDTVCVAGAVPDRPELYIRILGPRPNGFLWPTLVRFTPSAVTVEIEQVSTGVTQTYELEAVGPGSEELPGLQDRDGFLP